MQMPTLLLVVFTLVSTVGAYLIVAHHRGPRAGTVGGLLTFLFFSLLFWGVHALLRQGGFT